MAKNKDINISPSKGISIVIKNEFPSQLPINLKRKENIDALMYYLKHQHQQLCNQQVM